MEENKTEKDTIDFSKNREKKNIKQEKNRKNRIRKYGNQKQSNINYKLILPLFLIFFIIFLFFVYFINNTIKDNNNSNTNNTNNTNIISNNNNLNVPNNYQLNSDKNKSQYYENNIKKQIQSPNINPNTNNNLNINNNPNNQNRKKAQPVIATSDKIASNKDLYNPNSSYNQYKNKGFDNQKQIFSNINDNSEKHIKNIHNNYKKKLLENQKIISNTLKIKELNQITPPVIAGATIGQKINVNALNSIGYINIQSKTINNKSFSFFENKKINFFNESQSSISLIDNTISNISFMYTKDINNTLLKIMNAYGLKNNDFQCEKNNTQSCNLLAKDNKLLISITYTQNLLTLSFTGLEKK